jgi:hypothetical protein
LFLQLANMTTQGRVGDVHLLGGAADVAVTPDGFKGLESAEG